nr:hypothetical protein [Halorubrum coriense]
MGSLAVYGEEDVTRAMVGWECQTNPREVSGLDPEAVHGHKVVFSGVVVRQFVKEVAALPF